LGNWILKALIQGAISVTPMSEDLNFLFQKYVTHSVKQSKSSLSIRLVWCGKHIEYYRQYSSGQNLPSSALELGTGWLSTVPVGLYLSGIDTIYTVDIHDLRKREVQVDLLNVVTSFTTEELKAKLPTLIESRFDSLREMWRSGQTPEEIFQNVGIRFLIADARHLDLQAGTIPFFVSNTTFEHIPGARLTDILREFHRLATPDAVMSHLIDMSDHYEHFDHSLSVYSFLQHGPLVWRLVNNSLMYQNRLRINDFRAIHQTAGFKIVHEENYIKHAARLDEIKLAAAFREYSREDLIPSSSWMISKPV